MQGNEEHYPSKTDWSQISNYMYYYNLRDEAVRTHFNMPGRHTLGDLTTPNKPFDGDRTASVPTE